MIWERRRARKENQKKWEAPKIEYVGNVAEVLKGGEGKLPVSPADPGEARKPTGGEGPA